MCVQGNAIIPLPSFCMYFQSFLKTVKILCSLSSKKLTSPHIAEEASRKRPEREKKESVNMATAFRIGDTVIASRHAGWHEIKGTIEAVLDNGLVRVQWTGGEAAHELNPDEWFSFDRLEAYEEDMDVIEEPTSAFGADDMIFA